MVRIATKSQAVLISDLGRPNSGQFRTAPEFDRAMASPRIAYATGQALAKIAGGILRCLTKKNNPKFAGFIPLVQAPLLSLPRERWGAVNDILRAAASSLPFGEVYVMSNADEDPWAIQIKSVDG
jgi:hypothetical protein